MTDEVKTEVKVGSKCVNPKCFIALEDAASFCSKCGADQRSSEKKVAGWGPGSAIKRRMDIPIRHTEGGQEIVVTVNGRQISGKVPVTFDEYQSYMAILNNRVLGDYNSRHGERGSKRQIDVHLGTISGR